MAPVTRLAISFLAGVLIAQQFTHLPPPAVFIGLAPLAVAAWKWPWLRWVMWAALGCVFAVWRADLALGPDWPVTAMKRDVEVSGYVAGIPQKFDHGVRFRFVIDNAKMAGRSLDRFPHRVRLSWYGRPPLLSPGQPWKLRVRLKPPNGFMNPGGFDYEAWLFRHGVRATGYVRPHGGKRLEGLVLTPSVRLDRARLDLARRIQATLPPSEQRGVLLALTLGIRDQISPQRWTSLLDTGTNHLMAISGLHVGLVAGLIFWLVRRAWSLVPALPLWFPAPRAAAVFALLAATLYAALAGFSIPTQRALIMLAIGLGGILFLRRPRPAPTLAVALLIVLLLYPLAVLDAGFWLSFAAVGVLLYAVAGRGRATGNWLKDWGRVQWALLLGLLPLTALLFQRAAPIAPLANLIAVPWVGFGVVPLALLGTAFLVIWQPAGAFLLGLAALILQGLWPVLDFLAALPWGHVRLGMASWAALVFALVGAAWLLAPRGWPSRWVGALLFAPLLWPPPSYPPAGSWRLDVLDVGQGFAAVVQTAHHTLVFDSGPRYGSNFDAGSAVVAPYLRHLALRRIDLFVISHDDNDHSGGAASLLAAWPGTPLLASNPASWPGAKPCHAGERWIWDGVRFEMLSPLPTGLRGRNNRSCVLRIGGEGGSALLLSDIEARAERTLMAHWGQRLEAEVMIVPHHGSTTSSTAAFLDAVRPRLALLSTGFGNRFGFPKAKIMRRYQKRGIKVVDTAQDGMLSVLFTHGRGMQLQPGYRSSAGRYWNRRPAHGPVLSVNRP